MLLPLSFSAFLLVSIASFFPAIKFRSWPLEVLCNLQGYLLFAHLFAQLLAFLLKRKLAKYFKHIFILNLVLLLAITSKILPFYFSKSQELKPVSDPIKVKILYANVLTRNNKTDLLKKIIQEESPDIVTLLELNQKWSDGLSLKKTYKNYFEILREDNFGLGVYSKFPFEADTLSDLQDNINPIFLNKLIVAPAKKIDLALLHSIPPLSSRALYMNTLLLRRLSSKLRFVEGPVVVLGDFNATPFSSYYRNFTEWADMRSAFEGLGLKRTWNAFNPLLRLTLDHILYKGLKVEKASVGPAFGSDHLPLIVEFLL